MDSFENVVRKMRAAQKEYFRTRSMDALREAKALEKEVDEWLKEMQNPQPTLRFAEGETAND